ncbi:hypothetical protein CN242_05225 [Sinorhizobium meliloti]|nr:hypothetical protein [Sinorhizobium meliloti]MQW47514.1 hypothetical protein [Sinorhizobium meliloti]MQX64047.1 hypothetical protein [Sinorhizobium meliloti]RVI42159.1 hypothetical protein CN195_30425 [Sinorhizobium meliloti]RVL46846.1 hypothetical protein CN146_07580 [Sinorhizobium meliloti]
MPAKAARSRGSWFPTARKAKLGLFDARLGGGQAAIRPISYQQIIEIARQVGLDQLCTDLSEWVGEKITRVSSRRRRHPLERDAFRRNRKGDSFFCANQIHHSGR